MKKICVLLSLLFLNSCREREMAIKLPYEGDKMVVYAIFSPIDTVKVLVSKTYPPSTKIIYGEGIKDADVSLYENSVMKEKLVYNEKGYYTSAEHFKPKAGFSYSLKINSPTLPSITTNEEVIPDIPIVESYQFNEKMESNLNKGSPAKKLFLTLKDNTSNADFFSVELYGLWNIYRSALNSFFIDQASGTDSPCFFGYSGKQIMSDICFQGGTFQFKRGYELNPVLIVNDGWVRKDLDKVEAQIRTVTKSYYEFARTQYTVTQLEQAFSPPYPRYSNIKGGYGIFAAYNEIILELPAD